MKPTLTPYLHFNGDCRTAMEFYKSVLGGELIMQTYGEAMPEGTPPEHKDKVMHAYLKNDSLSFMASDSPPGSPTTQGDNVHLSIVGEDKENLTEFFNKLAEGGKVTMKLEKQFWGDEFGMLTDKFGVHWMVNIGTPQ